MNFQRWIMERFFGYRNNDCKYNCNSKKNNVNKTQRQHDSHLQKNNNKCQCGAKGHSIFNQSINQRRQEPYPINGNWFNSPRPNSHNMNNPFRNNNNSRRNNWQNNRNMDNMLFRMFSQMIERMFNNYQNMDDMTQPPMNIFNNEEYYC